jgi:transcriptional regulator with XRE-family HTH domain
MLLRRLIGEVLRRTRLAQGRTLREVAATARVSMAYLSELERGRKEVSSELLAAICRALHLTLAELLDQVREELLRLEPEQVPVAPQLRTVPTRPAARPSARIPVRAPDRRIRLQAPNPARTRPTPTSPGVRSTTVSPTCSTTWSMNPYSLAS